MIILTTLWITRLMLWEIAEDMRTENGIQSFSGIKCLFVLSWLLTAGFLLVTAYLGIVNLKKNLYMEMS